MSVLSFPRIYFKGFIEWDPCTFNNNDWQAFPTYDGANAALNWSFLKTQGELVPPGITPDNFTTTFRPWAIKLQKDVSDTPPGDRIPAEWNMFGTHGVSFVQYQNYTTTIIGGELKYRDPVTSDPLIGGPVSINGDNGSGPGRLVDSNPFSFWSSQVYLDQLSFGSGNCVIKGTPSVRMHSRWLNLSRIYTQDQVLTQPAASVACCFQAGIPYNQISWPAASANSTLATKLQEAASQSPAQGIMVRFTAYVNLYFRNGVFNGITSQPSNYEELAALMATAWEAWNTNGDTSKFFSQPCYSHTVGVVGVWNEGELATVPGGRYLAADKPVAPKGTAVAPAAAASPPMLSLTKQVAKAKMKSLTPVLTLLGPLVANVDYDAKLISLDLNSTMPENGTPGEWPSDLTKTHFGPLSLGVVGSDGGFTQIVEIDYSQYDDSSYSASAGIIDIPFPDSGTKSLLENNMMAIQVQGQTALLEQNYSAQTDTRTIYLDQNAQAEFNITACRMGTPSAANILIAKYDSNLSLIPSNQTQFVNFTNGNQQTITVNGVTTDVTIVTADANGIATIGIEAQSSGFPVLAFFPYSGNTLPQPPASLIANGPLITYAFYTTVRVLPFDDAVPQAFVDLWNSTYDSAKAWQFIYNQILYVYDMLFSVMLEHVNLGSQQAVEQSLSSVWNSISEDAAAASTYAMPITRDLSAGKRLALQLWIYLVANNYNVPNFNVNSIPAGWAPPHKKSAFGKTTKPHSY